MKWNSFSFLLLYTLKSTIAKRPTASQIWETERKYFLRSGHVTQKDELFKERY